MSSEHNMPMLMLMELETFQSTNQQVKTMQQFLLRKEMELRRLRKKEAEESTKAFFNLEQEADLRQEQEREQQKLFIASEIIKQKQRDREKIQPALNQLSREQEQQQEQLYLDYEHGLLCLDLLFTENLLLVVESEARSALETRQKRSFHVISTLHELQVVHPPSARSIDVSLKDLRRQRLSQARLVSDYIHNVHLYPAPSMSQNAKKSQLRTDITVNRSLI
eukprot:TRINITY_DN20306_c0_g1_i1.p1 TRINITY_DN20306_c0_g1~~TRINITY_DN20306_c0_g1_i1.p1  ORF type:complete len:222 (+),score=52.87 TRINITY_DN20306_c0_g1_i1:99-764(+)